MRLKNLLAVLPILVLAACSGEKPALEAISAPRTGPPRGIDIPIDSRDVSSELRTSGLDFVARYYRSAASRWPTLSANEATVLSSNGFKIVAVWESHSHIPGYFSYSSGYWDADNAYRQAKAINQPPGSAIYFAVDF